MSTSFRGKVTQIAGDLVQVWDARSGHSIFIDRGHIEGGEELRLNDEVAVRGEDEHRRGLRLSGSAAHASAQSAAAD
ncbi:MAG: hypothetical protein ACLFTL_12580 [Alphaproteobacteria bacterium]